MDGRLVFAEARSGCAEGLLHPAEPARRARGRQLRSPNDQRQDSTKGHQGRLASVRAELLPTLPAGSATRGAGRHIHESSRLSMHPTRNYCFVTNGTMTPCLIAYKELRCLHPLVFRERL